MIKLYMGKRLQVSLYSDWRVDYTTLYYTNWHMLNIGFLCICWQGGKPK